MRTDILTARRLTSLPHIIIDAPTERSVKRESAIKIEEMFLEDNRAALMKMIESGLLGGQWLRRWNEYRRLAKSTWPGRAPGLNQI